MSESTFSASTSTASRAPANPFILTESFRTGDKIFGRDSEIADFVTRVFARRIVLLHSPSGAGKTSLVQAGVIPSLNRKGVHIYPKILMRYEPPAGSLPPGPEYNRFLVSALISLDAGQGLSAQERLTSDEIAELSLSDSPLVEYLKNHAPYAENTRPKRSLQDGSASQRSAPVRSLLFFDQFEEILSLDPNDLEAKKIFFARIAPALFDYQMMAIFVMREEYLAGLDPYMVYMPDRLSTRFRLELLGRKSALEAIRKPILQVKVDFEKQDAELLVERLSQVTVREGGKEKKIPGQFVEPVQLQVVSSELFDRRLLPDQITLSDVQEHGVVENALGAFYDRRVKSVAAGDEALERKIRDWIEQELIISGSLRGLAPAGEEAKYGLVKGTIDQLIQAFLVREEPRRGVVWYELTHDSLIAPVISSNLAWRELHANEFEIQASRWNKAPPAERERVLPSGEALRQAVAWGEQHFATLSDPQKAYLSTARRELQRLEVRRDNRAELGINLEDTGWGIIFPAEAPSALREALKELLDHRRFQASRKRPTYYREFFGADGYRTASGTRPAETAQRFLARWEAGSGPANPEKMPYYLLIVGDPDTIPFEFQYALDAQYAVGRIYFETLEEYARYARSVVTSETKYEANEFSLPNRLVIFAPQHPDDPATNMSLNLMARPAFDLLTAQQPNWRVDSLFGEQATKANLAQALGGDTPAVFFSISHSLNWAKGHPDQLDSQGALVCQDWPGVNKYRESGLKPADFSFSGQDIPRAGNLLGSIIFTISDYTAGTPAVENYPTLGQTESRALTEKAFLARLPQRLLSQAPGGALAVVGHVDRVWTKSFVEVDQSKVGGAPTSDIGAYIKLMTRLMVGSTAGLAMEDLNRRFSYFSALLGEELIGITFYNRPRDENKLFDMLVQTIDARNYILIGDPAVRLPVHADQPYQAPPADWQRPSLGPVSVPMLVEITTEALTPPTIPPAEPQQGEAPVAGGPAQPPIEQIPPEIVLDLLSQVNVESLAQALIKGQKLKLSDIKSTQANSDHL